MGYPAKLLAQGESIAFEMRPHWRSMIVPSIVLVGTVTLGFVGPSTTWFRRQSSATQPAGMQHAVDVRFIDTTFRDGSQSLWATRITTGMMDAVAPEMARAALEEARAAREELF